MERCLEVAQQRGHVWYALTLFLLHTGTRWGETRDLRWEDVDLERHVVRLRAQTAKNAKERQIPLLLEVTEELRKLDQVGEYVFMREYRGKWIAMPRDGRIGDKSYPWLSPRGAGVDVSPHAWRHTFATWHLRAGTSIAIVSKWLGHSTIKLTVDTYGHIEAQHHKEEMERVARPREKKDGA